jgi:hypothetical protein
MPDNDDQSSPPKRRRLYRWLAAASAVAISLTLVVTFALAKGDDSHRLVSETSSVRVEAASSAGPDLASESGADAGTHACSPDDSDPDVTY